MNYHIKVYIQALICAVTCPPDMVDKFTNLACDLSQSLTETQVIFCQEQAEAILSNL